MIWTDFYVDLTNHGLRRSKLSNPVDPIQPQIGVARRLQYNTGAEGKFRAKWAALDFSPTCIAPCRRAYNRLINHFAQKGLSYESHSNRYIRGADHH